MMWTIQNSIDLSKLYPVNETKLYINNNFSKSAELLQFCNAFKIPYYLFDKNYLPIDRVYFGSLVTFQNLYIITGIIKSYGIKEIYFRASLQNKITLGPLKRRIVDNETSIKVDEILNLPFDLCIKDFFKLFNLNLSNKINIIEYGLEEGLISKEDLESQKIAVEVEVEDDDQDSDLDVDLLINLNSSNNDYDPDENFHWGGLSGQEAYDGYWNTQ